MDISKVTNIIELKALAYDIMRERERLRGNLDLVMQRISDLEYPTQGPKFSDEKPKRSP